MQSVAFSSRCFVTSCEQQQKNERRMLTHAIIIVAVARKVYLIKLPETEQTAG